ncbi:MAG: hypothetical protein AAFQ36_12860 [Pseudomonadota bacterium]
MSTLFVDGFYSASASEFETYSQIVGRDDLGNPLETINLSISWDQNLNLSEELGSQAVRIGVFSSGYQFTSGDGDDRLSGNFMDAIIVAGGGDDQITGGLFGSTLNGGLGDDFFEIYSSGGPNGTINGGVGYDTVQATSLNLNSVNLLNIDKLQTNRVFGTTDQIEAIPVIDAITSTSPTKFTIYGSGDLDLSERVKSARTDVSVRDYINLTLGESEDRVHGTLTGTISTGDGNDTLEGDFINAALSGGDGDDAFILPFRADLENSSVDGGSGNDTLSAFSLDLRELNVVNVEELSVAFQLTATVEQMSQIASLTGSPNKIQILGSGDLDLTDVIKDPTASVELIDRVNLTTGATEDRISGIFSGEIQTGDGDDTLRGSISGGQIDSGQGDDEIEIRVRSGEWDGTVSAGDGDDTILVTENGGSTRPVVTLEISGGEGRDILTLEYLDFSGSTIQSIEHLIIDDARIGSSQLSSVESFSGRDILLDGGGVFDLASFSGSRLDVTVVGSENTTVFAGEAAMQARAGSGNARLVGGEGEDFLTGFRFGAESRDILIGAAGDDILSAGLGRTKMFGGLGDDELRIHGSAERASIKGGAGDDIFEFRTAFASGRVVIRDFGNGDDQLRFQGLSDLDFDGIQSLAKQKKNSVLLKVDDFRIILRKTDVADLSEDDFVF